MVIVGFALVALIPLLVLYASERAQMEMAVSGNQARQIAREIVDAAEMMYYLGPPSRTTLKAYIPSNVREINITSNEVIFSIYHRGQISHVAEQSSVNLTGAIPAKSGIRGISIEALEGGVLIS